MNETGLKLLGALVPAAMSDALAILRRRGAIFAIVAIALPIVATLVVTDANRLLVNWALVSGGSAFTLLSFSEAMRIAQPDYRLNIGRVARLLWYGVLFFVLVVLCYLIAAIPFAMLYPWARSAHGFAIAVLDIVCVVLTARFAFLCFLCEYDGFLAFSFSWRLTAGRALLATLFASALYTLPFAIAQSIFDRPYPRIPLALYEGTHVFVQVVIAFATASFFYPIMMRWLSVCERLHPEIGVGALSSPTAPDANLV